jgi:hypothetical protein
MEVAHNRLGGMMGVGVARPGRTAHMCRYALPDLMSSSVGQGSIRI